MIQHSCKTSGSLPLWGRSLDGSKTLTCKMVSVLSCINGCAALLYLAFLPAAASCAVLSTHDLPCIQYNADDKALWRNVSWTRFWEKPIWILPVHRSSPMGHWVLCTIYFPCRQLLLFDSLAEQQPWRKDVKVSYPCKPFPY